MHSNSANVYSFDRLKVEVHPDSESAGRAAARAAAECMRQIGCEQDAVAVIFATGASQLDMLRALVATPDIPWNKIVGFHLDEYVDLDEDHAASFRRYLRENLTSRVRMREFFALMEVLPIMMLYAGNTLRGSVRPPLGCACWELERMDTWPSTSPPKRTSTIPRT